MKTKSKEKTEVDLQPQIEQLKNQLARALADYDNLSKRVAKEREEFSKLANSRLILKLLPILDMLESAQAHLADPGLAITTKEFRDVLKAEGFEEINPKKGEAFNEELHEAIDVVESSDKDADNTIAEVSMSGWKYTDGTVIRHAKVKVFKKEK